MGQYHVVVNLDKLEYLHAHRFGEGLKLMEFGCDGEVLMTGLAVLLSNSNGRGGGDFGGESPLVGHWAGNRIVIAGDYAESGDAGEPMSGPNLYERCSRGEFLDISLDVIKMLKGYLYMAGTLKERGL